MNDNDYFADEQAKIKKSEQKVVVAKFATTTKKGSHPTAKAVAKKTGVAERTVRSAEKFNKAYEKVKEIDSDVAGKIAAGKIKDAIMVLYLK